MIADAKFYYGAVLSSIVSWSDGSISYRAMPKYGAGFYLVNERQPLLIKYSTTRKSPWLFNFQKEHQESQESLYKIWDECYVAFVCGSDGIAAVSHQDFRAVLDNNFEEQEAIRISRKLNQMYRLSGRDGDLSRRVSRSSLKDIFKKK